MVGTVNGGGNSSWNSVIGVLGRSIIDIVLTFLVLFRLGTRVFRFEFHLS